MPTRVVITELDLLSTGAVAEAAPVRQPAGRAAVQLFATGVLVVALLAAGAVALVPKLGGFRPVTVLTGSMEPLFGAGDVIISARQPVASVQEGDVITFRAPIDGQPVVTHRVVEVLGEDGKVAIRTKGDANPAADPWVASIEGDTVWRQQAVIPHAGVVLQWLHRPEVRRTLVYGSLLAVLIFGMRSIWTMPARSVD